MSVASRAIFSNFFEEQSTQNHPQYLSGLSRALFPTTFLEIAVYEDKSTPFFEPTADNSVRARSDCLALTELVRLRG